MIRKEKNMKKPKLLKKIIALLLTLTMAVACFTFGASAAQSVGANDLPQDYTTMLLLNDLSWDKTYIYALDENGEEVCGRFPGVELKEKIYDSDNREILLAVLPDGIESVFFSDGGTERTENIRYLTNGLYRITEEQNSQQQYKYTLEEDYGEDNVIWIADEFGKKTLFYPKNINDQPYYDEPGIDITSYPKYRFSEESLYDSFYMVQVPEDFKSLKLTVGTGYYRDIYTASCSSKRGSHKFVIEYYEIMGDEIYELNDLCITCLTDGYFTRFQYGDSNLDRRITIGDVTRIQYELAEIGTPMTQLNKEVSDVTRDGRLTIGDATAIQYYIADYFYGYAQTGENYIRAENEEMKCIKVYDTNLWDKMFVSAWDADGNLLCGNSPGYAAVDRYPSSECVLYEIYLPKKAVKMVLSNSKGEKTAEINPRNIPDDIVNEFHIAKYGLFLTGEKDENGNAAHEIKLTELMLT